LHAKKPVLDELFGDRRILAERLDTTHSESERLHTDDLRLTVPLANSSKLIMLERSDDQTSNVMRALASGGMFRKGEFSRGI
jgi:hypothetical protein